jgi:hypothetical protein
MDTPRRQQLFFRWFIITWPLVVLICFIAWAWLFYAFFTFSVIYLIAPLFKRLYIWAKNNPTRLTIVIILFFASVATMYIWYDIEWHNFMANHVEDLTGESLTWNVEHIMRGLEMRHYQTGFAMARISLVWLVSIAWSVFLGLKSRIKQ